MVNTNACKKATNISNPEINKANGIAIKDPPIL